MELYPILALVGTFREALRGTEVRVVCDNQPLVHNLNFLSSSSAQVMCLLRPLVLLLLEGNITIEAEYIRSSDNWICDTLSRKQVSEAWLRRQGLEGQLTRVPDWVRPEALRLK